MNKAEKELYEFGGFRLDSAERLLSRGGESVPLAPKTFDLLLALVDQPGRLLERDTLLKAVWPDTFVEDNNLADNISRLRKALGEGENGRKFIETVPRRGYRFVVDVRKGSDREAERIGKIPTTRDEGRPASRNRPAMRLVLVVGVVSALTTAGAWLNWRAKKSAEVDLLRFKGNFHLSNWNEGDVRKGIEYYREAIALNPNLATAYEGLANGWIFLSDLHVAPREAMPSAKAATIKALELNSRSSMAHLSLAVIKTQYDWDWAGAEREFKLALELDPESAPAHQLYGWYLTALGRHEEALEKMKRLQDLDPLNDFALWGTGLSLYFAGRREPAIEQYRRAIALEPRSYWPHMLLGWVYEQQGKFTEAIAELKQASRLFDDNPHVVASLGYIYARSGEGAAAQEVIAGLHENARRRYTSPYDVAAVFAGLGDKEQTLAWLERAYEDRSGWMAWWMKVDPRFDTLRSDPRFLDLLRRRAQVTHGAAGWTG